MLELNLYIKLYVSMCVLIYIFYAMFVHVLYMYCICGHWQSILPMYLNKVELSLFNKIV